MSDNRNKRIEAAARDLLDAQQYHDWMGEAQYQAELALELALALKPDNTDRTAPPVVVECPIHQGECPGCLAAREYARGRAEALAEVARWAEDLMRRGGIAGPGYLQDLIDWDDQ